MANYDEVVKRNKDYLTQAQINALAAASKEYNIANAGNRAGALASAREQYDTAYRGLQNMGLAGNPNAAPASGEVPRLQMQVKTPFDSYNERLKQVENQRLGALGEQFKQDTIAQRQAEEAARAAQAEAMRRAQLQAAAQTLQSTAFKVGTTVMQGFANKVMGIPSMKKENPAGDAATKAQVDGLKRTDQVRAAAAGKLYNVTSSVNAAQERGAKLTQQYKGIVDTSDKNMYVVDEKAQAQRIQDVTAKARADFDAAQKNVTNLAQARHGGGNVSKEEYENAVAQRDLAKKIADNPDLAKAFVEKNNPNANIRSDANKTIGQFFGKEIAGSLGYEKPTMTDYQFNTQAKIVPDVRRILRVIDAERNPSGGARVDQDVINEELAELEKLGHTEESARKMLSDFDSDRNARMYYPMFENAYVALYSHDGEKPNLGINSKETDATYRAVNNLPDLAVEKYNNQMLDNPQLGPVDALWTDQQKALGNVAYMTKEQRDAYNSIYEREGIEAANQYAKDIQPIVELKRAADDQDFLETLATNNGLEAWALARATNLISSIPAMVERLSVGVSNQIQDFKTGSSGVHATYSPNSAMSRASNWADIIQSKQSQNILDKYNAQGREGLGKVVNFLYQTGTSMADSAIAMTLAGGGAPWMVDALFFSSAGNQGYKDAIARGGTQEQAMAYGILSGIAEALFEHLSIEHFLSMDHKGKFALIRNMMSQSFAEASEEVSTEIANILSDVLVMKDKSEYNELVSEYGEEGAIAQLLKNVSMAGLGGLASGLGFGVVGTGRSALNAAMTAREKAKIGAAVKEYGDLEQLKSTGVLLGGDALAAAEKVEKNASNYNVGALYAAVNESIQNLNATDVDSQVAVQRSLDGKKMTTEEASDVLDVLKPDTVAKLGYDTSSPEAFASSYNERVEQHGITSKAERMAKSAAKKFAKAKEAAANRVWANPEQGLAMTTPEGNTITPMPGNMTAVALAEQERTGFKTRSSATKGNVTYAVAGMEARQGLSNEKTYAEIQKGFTKEARKKAQIYEKLADALGVKMVIHDVMVGTNGFIDENGNMHVVLSGRQSVLRVAAHELTHFMKEHAGTEYASMREYLIGEVGQAKFDRLVKQKAKEYGLDLDTEKGRVVADDEVCAELCERMLSNEEPLTRFAEKDTKAAKTLKAHLLEILNAIKSAFKQAENRDFGKSWSDLIKSQDTIESWITGLQKAIDNAEMKAETAADEARAKQFQANEALYITEEDAMASRAQAKLQSEVESDIQRGTTVSGYDTDTINGIIRSTLDTVGGETVLSKDALKQARARIAQTVRTAEAFLLDIENDAKQQALNDRTRQVATEIVDAYQATEGENAGALAELKDFLIGSDKTVVIGIGPNQMADIRSQYESPMVLQGKLAKALGARVQLVGKTNAKYESAWKMDELYEQLREKYNLSDDQSFTSDAQNLVDFIDGIRQQDEGVTAGIGDSETREQAILDVQQALMDQVLKAAGAKTSVEFSLDTDSKRAQREYEEKTDAIYNELTQARQDLSNAERKRNSILESKEYNDAVEAVGNAKGDDLDAAIRQYVDFMNRSGANEAQRTIDALQKKVQQLKDQFDKVTGEKAASDREKAIEKSGLSEQDYDRKQAAKEFGYTPHFYDAGYMLPDGKMLNFSGEKGKHFGTRGQDHRAIGVIYDDSQGSEAMIRFMNGGNIRVMGETPGIDISNVMEPTPAQYERIRQFARESAGKRFFNVDISDENGNSIGALSYEGRVSPDKVVNDIKHYFATGEIRQQSDVSKFLYSLDTDYMRLAEKQKNGTLTKEDESKLRKMVNEAAKAAGYDLRAYHGTPNGTFNTFRSWQYFTTNKEYANLYQGQGASSNGYKKTATNRRTYDTFIKMEKPFDTRNAAERKIFMNEFYRQWGNGAPLSDRGLPDWTDGDDLIEFFEDKGYDYDGILLDEGGVGGYGEDVKDRGISYVIKDSSQIKSADPVTYDDQGNIIPLSERFNQEKEDIRYDLDTETLREIQPPTIEQQVWEANEGVRYSTDTWRKPEKKPGMKPAGREPRVREVDVPQYAKTGNPVSDFVRSFLESDKATDEMVRDLQQKIEDGDWGSYTRLTNKEAMDRASDYIARRSLAQAQSEFHDMVASGKYNVNTRALGLKLLSEAASRGDQKLVLDIAADLRELATDAGQSVQIFNVLKGLGGLGSAWYMQKKIDKLNSKYAKEISSGKMNEITVDPDLMQDLAEARTTAEVEKAEDEIAKAIALQLPLTWASRISNWRYLAMLGNPTTHFRNITGNALMTVLNTTKDAVATGIEKLAVKDVNERAHAVLTGSDRKTWGDFASKSFKEQEKNLRGTGKYGFENQLKQYMRSFDTKWLNKIAQFNFDKLEQEDLWFIRPAYRNALMQHMKAQGYTLQDGKAGKIVDGEFKEISTEEMNKAIEWASNQAWKATFRDASTVASILNSVSKKLGPVGNVLIEGVMPFKKTPINIAKRGIEYSPAGVIMGAVQLAKDVKTGKVTKAQAIDNLASGLVGTALMALGAALAKAGIIRAGGDDDKKLGTYNTDTGKQAYSIQIGNVSFDISALAPSTIPLFMGAALHDALDKNGEGVDPSALVETAASTLNPFMEMSFMSSLNSALKNYNQNGIGGALGNTLLTAAESYGSQFLPTVVGKIGQAFDPTTRTTKSSAASPLGSNLDYYARSLIKKVPGLEAMLQPDVNVWGRETKKDTFAKWALDWANKFILPFTVKVAQKDAIDDELIRLVETTGNVDILPSDGDKKFKVDGETYPMTAAQYTEFSKDRGQASYAALKEVMLSSAYKTATDEERAGMLQNALSAAQKQVNTVWKEKLGAMDTSKQETGIKAIKGDYSDPALYKVAANYPNMYDKAAKAKSQGVSPDTFLSIYEKKENYVGDDRSDYVRQEIMNSNLTPKQKELMDDLIVSDKGYNPDYSSQAWFDVSMLGKIKYDEAKMGAQVGLKPETYYKVYTKWKTLDAKDANGKTVNGLKKKRAKEYLDSLTLSGPEYSFIWTVMFGY